MNVIGHRHDAIRVPFVQSAKRFTDRAPSGVIRQAVAARHDAKRNKINDFAFPRQHHWNVRGGRAIKLCRASVSDASLSEMQSQ